MCSRRLIIIKQTLGQNDQTATADPATLWSSFLAAPSVPPHVLFPDAAHGPDAVTLASETYPHRPLLHVHPTYTHLCPRSISLSVPCEHMDVLCMRRSRCIAATHAGPPFSFPLVTAVAAAHGSFSLCVHLSPDAALLGHLGAYITAARARQQPCFHFTQTSGICTINSGNLSRPFNYLALPGREESTMDSQALSNVLYAA